MKYDPYLSWEEDYIPLENQFRNYIRYVPIVDEHKDVWSLELANQLLKIGSSVDSFFKCLMRHYIDEFLLNTNSKTDSEIASINELDVKLKKNQMNMNNFRNALEDYYKFSQKNICILRNKQKIKPFEEWTNDESPKWWHVYTKLKHNKYRYKELATLETVVNALAGLFLLNIIHRENSEYLYSIGVLKTKDKFPRHYNAVIAKTNLFGYLFPQPKPYSQDPLYWLFEHKFE